jgi:hypothetical protein
MAAAGATRPGTVYGLLVGLGAGAAGASRALLCAKVVTTVSAHFGAAAVTLHPTAEGWAESFSDPRELARLSALDRARVETLDARLVREALVRDARVSALDLDKDLAAENYLADVLGVSDVFAVPLKACGAPAGALVLYLDARSAPPSETDLCALSGVGDVLALAGPPPSSLAPPVLREPAVALPAGASPAPSRSPSGLLRRLFSR